mmetsp:Transcript_27827/g.93573  ORF Transcript_27827/g.93573 Transcript_27827/m.93573 type:complete len:228 (+) Transcript_27827:618-1301(+)
MRGGAAAFIRPLLRGLRGGARGVGGAAPRPGRPLRRRARRGQAVAGARHPLDDARPARVQDGICWLAVRQVPLYQRHGVRRGLAVCVLRLCVVERSHALRRHSPHRHGLVFSETVLIGPREEGRRLCPRPPGRRQRRLDRLRGGSAGVARVADVARRAPSGGHHLLLRHPLPNRLVHPTPPPSGCRRRQDAAHCRQVNPLQAVLYHGCDIRLLHANRRLPPRRDAAL